MSHASNVRQEPDLLNSTKNTSIRRLRKLFFGARTEKTDAVLGRSADSPDGRASGQTAGDGKPSAEESDETESDEAAAHTLSVAMEMSS